MHIVHIILTSSLEGLLSKGATVRPESCEAMYQCTYMRNHISITLMRLFLMS